MSRSTGMCESDQARPQSTGHFAQLRAVFVPAYDTALFVPVAQYDAFRGSITEINGMYGRAMCMTVQQDIDTVLTNDS